MARVDNFWASEHTDGVSRRRAWVKNVDGTGVCTILHGIPMGMLCSHIQDKWSIPAVVIRFTLKSLGLDLPFALLACSSKGLLLKVHGI